MLVTSQGVRVNQELFSTHENEPSNGMVRTFANITAGTEKYDWRYGFINTQGRVVAKPIYKEANPFSSGLARVATAQGSAPNDPQGRWAYIDTQGRTALQLGAQWVDAHDFHHGLALVRGKGYMTGTHPMSSIGPRRIAPPWSVINTQGRIVMGYDRAKDTSPAVGYTALEWHSSVSFTAPEMDIRSDFIGGKAVFRRVLPTRDKLSDALGLVDAQGRVVVEQSDKHWVESSLREAYPSPSAVEKPSAKIAKKFYSVSDFHEGLAFATGSHWVDRYGSNRFSGTGIIDLQGRWVVAERDHLNVQIPFRDGHAVVHIYESDFGQSTALMDRTGRIVAKYAKLLKKSEVANPG